MEIAVFIVVPPLPDPPALHDVDEYNYGYTLRQGDGGSPIDIHLEPEAGSQGLRNGKPSRPSRPRQGARWRATLLSEVTHVSNDAPARRHPAGTVLL